LYDPQSGTSFIAHGEKEGRVTEKPVGNKFTFDSIFFIPEKRKTYAEMNLDEKNAISHRGKALTKVKYYLQNQYGTKHIVVPFGLVIKNGKILLLKRNDPHRPAYHGKWEFPGGSVEYGEAIHDNVVREVHEETGYKVQVVKMLQHIATDKQSYPTYKYQVYLIPHVCKIVGGKGNPSDSENLGQKFVDLDKVSTYDLIGNDKKMFKKFLPELKKIVNLNKK
jgi:mutator protein MutT